MIKVQGMSCMHCKGRVEAALKSLGLKKITIDIETGIVTYKENKKVTQEQIKEAIESAGYEVL